MNERTNVYGFRSHSATQSSVFPTAAQQTVDVSITKIQDKLSDNDQEGFLESLLAHDKNLIEQVLKCLVSLYATQLINYVYEVK